MSHKKCPACGTVVLFVTDAEGTIHPLDVSAPVFCVEAVGPDLRAARAPRTIPGGLAPGEAAYLVSHFATCPQADRFSRKGR